MLQGETLTHNKAYQEIPITWKPINCTKTNIWLQNHDYDEETRDYNEEDYDADDEIPDKKWKHKFFDKNERYNNDEGHNKAKAGRNPYNVGI